ncbi:uncharacterized protein C1orf127 homolog isoform X1 [Osmerus eperlanus]|uniref:uncharacterized protein C1orf127 homolog isoform X1 n=1 Tax=Osmerus eperlanus TaxID=29151 RepID=UPI002E120933
MAKARFGIFQSVFVVTLISVFPIEAMVLKSQKRDWMDNSPATFREGDLECFSDYMEVWIHRMRIEGLRLWLSGAMRIQVVNLGSLDRLNSQLSACGFSLHNDPDKNYIFRAMYSGCLVQQQYGNNVLVLNLAKGIQRFGGRSQNFIMKCPLVSAASNTEHIQCDSDYIQVTRQIPQDSWNNELQWSLALRGSLIVALEDASLIQLNIDKAGTSLTLQGRRREIMSPVTVLEKIGEFLALKLVSGQYAYSMEATCPEVSQNSAEETVLHIFKRRMGLTKRGIESDTFTLNNVSVDGTDVFTVHENRDFVQLIIPTALILQTKPCTTDQGLLQPFYRVQVQLTFKETNHQMYWIMENSFPCTVSGTNAPIPTLRPTISSSTSPAEAYTTGSETGDPNTTLKPTVSYPSSPTDTLTTLDDDQITTTTATTLPTLSYTLSMPEAYTTDPVTNEQRLPVTRDGITRTPKPTLSFSTSTHEAFMAYRTSSGTDRPIATASVDLTTISIPNPLEAALSSFPDVYTTAPAKPPGTSTYLHLSPDPPVEDLAVTWTDVSTSYPPDPVTTSSDSNTYTSNVTPLDLHGNEATRNTTEAADVGGVGAQDEGPQRVTLGSAGTRQPNQTESHSPQDGNGTQGMDFHSNSGTTESDRAVTEAMFQVGFQ